MRHVVVASAPIPWTEKLDGVEVVSPKDYLTDDRYAGGAGTVRVYNLAKSYRYQSLGYYVSLLAEARGHRPIPSVGTIRDFRTPSIARIGAYDLEDLIQKSLGRLESDRFVLSIYFGKNLAKRHERLSQALFDLFPAPLLQAKFKWSDSDDQWVLRRIGPLPLSEVPPSHLEFVAEAAQSFFARRPRRAKRSTTPRWELALLVDPKEELPPSDERALRRFTEAAEDAGMDVERIEERDIGRVAEFDGLFIRATTFVDHYTYRFARRAEAEGLVVVDDPTSILRCTNKVYLAELLRRHRIPAPRTMVVHRGNADEVQSTLGVPCVLKQPDSAFSLGVKRADDSDALKARLAELLSDSELVVAQEYLPTSFDWRVGVLGGEPLYICRYHMAPKHWQIMKSEAGQKDPIEGRVDAVRIAEAPREVVETAVRAARLIGDGLYGVDLKEVGGRVYVVEINDNPSLEAGYEDKIEGALLWEKLAAYFARKLEAHRVGSNRPEPR